MHLADMSTIENKIINCIKIRRSVADRNMHIVESFDFMASIICGDNDFVVILDMDDRIVSTYPIIQFENVYGKTLDIEMLSHSLFYEHIEIEFEKESLYRMYLLSTQNIDKSDLRILESVSKGIVGYIKKTGYYHEIINALNAIEEGMSIIDKNGILIFSNKASLSITGMQYNEMVGYPIETHIKEKPILLSVIEDGKTRIDFEYYLTIRNRTIHLINSAYPVKDLRGITCGAVDVFRSIKRSRKLADDLAGYHAIYSFDSIIGSSTEIKSVINEAKTYANSDKSVLIQGESGVGKELFAQSIHNHSFRANAPFVALNCANLPSELIDSELFGYEEGAFTGAKKQGKQGKFELANGGTVFLDEIGELPILLQAKLLRVLETKEISRIGSNKKMKIDIRIISATNRDLKCMIDEGRFRMDLLYRISVFEIRIPPLRERISDLPLIVDYFLERFAYNSNDTIKKMTQEAYQIFNQYSWPGNIRELENIIARAVYLSKNDEITQDSLLQCGIKLKSVGKIPNLTNVTRNHFITTLNECGGNKKKTAEVLGISRPTVYRLVKKYGMST